MLAWRSGSKYSCGRRGSPELAQRLEVLLGVPGDAGLVERVAE